MAAVPAQEQAPQIGHMIAYEASQFRIPCEVALLLLRSGADKIPDGHVYGTGFNPTIIFKRHSTLWACRATDIDVSKQVVALSVCEALIAINLMSMLLHSHVLP
ncbi:hypothetical protein [Selenomonas ruminantium]|uniref:hypothetical protein n=1 Tax=Selenomonas ruminantium TaxID=971 RepID=UPI0026F066B5|nr:hypothetical protein [Selenomonas ruminantium]